MTDPVRIVPSSLDDERLWYLVQEFADCTSRTSSLLARLLVEFDASNRIPAVIRDNLPRLDDGGLTGGTT